MSESIMIIGSTSLLAQQLAKTYAIKGYHLLLLARDGSEVGKIGEDLKIRHNATYTNIACDLTSIESIAESSHKILEYDELPRTIIFVAGYIPEELDKIGENQEEIHKMTFTNYLGPALFLSYFLPKLRNSTNPVNIVFVSSVAADRGRKSNYPYGAAKNALNTYAQGLRALLHPYGHCVLTVKMGYMNTRLAYGKIPLVLACSPKYAALKISQAVESKKFIIYLPGFWRLIMIALRSLPERVFIKLPIP